MAKVIFVDDGTMQPFRDIPNGGLFRHTEDKQTCVYMKVAYTGVANSVNLEYAHMYVLSDETKVIPLVAGQSVVLKAV